MTSGDHDNNTPPVDIALVDIAIVGGGPAGLSAALWSARYLHSVVLVDSGDPRNWPTLQVNGFLGVDGKSPPELRKAGRAQCREFGVTLLDAVVLRVDRHGDDHFELCLAGGRKVHARRVLLAIGIRDIWPDIPGLEHAYGSNAHVCPDCDGYGTLNKKVVVIGNGRRAVGMALDLSTWTHDIIICTNGREPAMDRAEYLDKLDALEIPVLTSPIRCVQCDAGRIVSLVLDDGMPLDCDKIFFAIGQYPADDLGAQLGCERDDDGHVIVDAHACTSVRHVFAAGDITPGAQIAMRAAASGATAALAMHKSLVPADRRLEPLAALATRSR